jgi:hypothetical protein
MWNEKIASTWALVPLQEQPQKMSFDHLVESCILST